MPPCEHAEPANSLTLSDGRTTHVSGGGLMAYKPLGGTDLLRQLHGAGPLRQCPERNQAPGSRSLVRRGECLLVQEIPEADLGPPAREEAGIVDEGLSGPDEIELGYPGRGERVVLVQLQRRSGAGV